MKDLKLITTKDSSHSLFVPALNETYHSTYGAIQESMHVFIHHGLYYWLANRSSSSVKLLEVGLGTALNALLTYLTSLKEQVVIEYTGLEPYPITWEYAQQLNYVTRIVEREKQFTQEHLLKTFKKLHQYTGASLCKLSTYFFFQRIELLLEDFFAPTNSFDIIYFDTFAPNKQVALWQFDLLQKVYQMMKSKGVWVTYCAKGQLKRDLRQLGMHVETLSGPPGKKEMVRAIKK